MDTHEHIVRSYEEELAALNNKIAKMGGLAEQVLGQSIDALEGRDPDLAAATIQQDEAIDLLRSKKQPDGTWLLENTHPGAVHFAFDPGDGQPSRWNTLRAMRVLRWCDAPSGP